MTDDEALDAYTAAWPKCPDIRGGLYDDEERRDNARLVRLMLAAPTLDDACVLIREWGNPAGNRACVRRLRRMYRGKVIQ